MAAQKSQTTAGTKAGRAQRNLRNHTKTAEQAGRELGEFLVNRRELRTKIEAGDLLGKTEIKEISDGADFECYLDGELVGTHGNHLGAHRLCEMLESQGELYRALKALLYGPGDGFGHVSKAERAQACAALENAVESRMS